MTNIPDQPILNCLAPDLIDPLWRIQEGMGLDGYMANIRKYRNIIKTFRLWWVSFVQETGYIGHILKHIDKPKCFLPRSRIYLKNILKTINKTNNFRMSRASLLVRS